MLSVSNTIASYSEDFLHKNYTDVKDGRMRESCFQ